VKRVSKSSNQEWPSSISYQLITQICIVSHKMHLLGSSTMNVFVVNSVDVVTRTYSLINFLNESKNDKNLNGVEC
jgi:hypothetical protein